MRRLVVLLVALAVVGCEREKAPPVAAPGLPANNGAAAVEAMKSTAAMVQDRNEGWKTPGAFDSAGATAENERLRWGVTDVRWQAAGADPKLVVLWKVTNLTDARKFDGVLPVEDGFFFHVGDEHGNSYSTSNTPDPIEGDMTTRSLRPGESATDALLIEAPVGAAKELRIWWRDDTDESIPAVALKVPIPAKVN